MATLKIGKLNINNGLLLAPMEGITDLPFRIICRDMGADIVYSEFISAEAIIRNARKSMQKMEIVEYERPVAVQIFGYKKESMADSAKIVEDSGADILDINYGCWVKKVVNHNGGAAFLKDPERMAEFTRAVAESVDIPVTAKTRLGWDSDSIVIVEVARMMEQAGSAALSVHCRTREMAMKGDADWSWIPEIKSAVESMPIILNGDVKTPKDAKRAFDETGCDAVMIGRGAIGNPFLFARAGKYLESGILPPEPSPEERINICLQHLQMNIMYNGYPRGLYEFRKHYPGYLKGYHLASKIRNRLVRTESYNEVEKILRDYSEYLKNEPWIEDSEEGGDEVPGHEQTDE